MPHFIPPMTRGRVGCPAPLTKLPFRQGFEKIIAGGGLEGGGEGGANLSDFSYSSKRVMIFARF